MNMERTIRAVIRIAFEVHPNLTDLAVKVKLNDSLEPFGVFYLWNDRVFTWSFVEESHEEVLHRFSAFCKQEN